MAVLTPAYLLLPKNQITQTVMEVVELMIVNIVFPTVIPPISVSPTVSRMEKKTRSKLATLLI
jgi:hypothetical protein